MVDVCDGEVEEAGDDGEMARVPLCGGLSAGAVGCAQEELCRVQGDVGEGGGEHAVDEYDVGEFGVVGLGERA